MKVKKGFDLTRLRTEYGFNYDDDNGIYSIYDSYGLNQEVLEVKSWNRELKFALNNPKGKATTAFCKMIKDGIIEI